MPITAQQTVVYADIQYRYSSCSCCSCCCEALFKSGSFTSNLIGMKFGTIVLQVNTHRLTESDFDMTSSIHNVALANRELLTSTVNAPARRWSATGQLIVIGISYLTGDIQEIQQGWETSAVAMHLIVARLLFCRPAIYRVGQKKVNPKCSTHNFVKYWPIFKILSLLQSLENLQCTVINCPTTPQTRRYTTLWNVYVRKLAWPVRCGSFAGR